MFPSILEPKTRTIVHLVLPAAMISISCGVLLAHSAGPDPRYTGAPGDSVEACHSCHQGQNLNSGQGSVKILLPNGNSYTPGVKQHILVQVSDPQQRRWGFQMSARLKSNQTTGQAGDFSPTDGFTQVICDNSNPKPCPANAVVQFIEHTSAGTRPGTSGGATFEFDWTPPATDSGNIVFYMAGNAANGDGNLTGDHIYTSSLEVTSSSPSAPPPAISATKYSQHNLVSDILGLADQTDPSLINPKGIALNSTGAFWISNNRTGTSSLYNGSGQPFPINNPRVVNIPAGPGGPPASLPAAQVFNGTPAFQIATGNPAAFIFATESGTISGWNPAVDAGNAKLMIDRSGSGAIYKGIAIGSNDSGALLYVANFSAGTVEVFDGNFQPARVSGNFNDPNLPAGLAPFNIRKIGRKLYVTYALQDSPRQADVPGPGNGLINAFDMDGNLVQRLVSNGPLNSPWGVALAPDFFGDYSNTLLVSNSGDGSVNAFDPFTGAFLGALQGSDGNPLNIPGVWALQFGNGHDGGDANTLYFTTGVAGGGNIGAHGLLGSIQVAQQP